MALVAGFAAGDVAAPPRGDAAARLPAGEDASEAWQMLARFESGHLLLAQALVTNLGVGDRKAAVIGFVVGPDDRVVPFRRTENQGHWRLSEDRRELDLRSIVLRAGPPPRRLVVDKDEIEVELELTPRAAPLAAGAATPDCPLDVLEVSSPARGRFWAEGMTAEVPLRGRAALTHRWSRELEARCVTRRLELFGLGDATGLYAVELVRPDGARRRWAVLERDDRVVWSGVPDALDVQWEADPDGFDHPRTLRLALPEGVVQVEIAPPVAELDVLERLPALVRPLIALRTRPRIRLSRASWQLGSGPRQQGLVQVSHLNPLPSAPSSQP